MTRVRVLLLFALALVAAGCVGGGGGSTELSDPAVRPGSVGTEVPVDAPADDPADDVPAPDVSGADPEPDPDAGAADPAPEETPAGGFVLEIPADALPSGPPPTEADADDEGALAGSPLPPTEIAFVQRSIDTIADQRYRFEIRFAMALDIDGQSISMSPSGPIATGAAVGSRQQTLMDLGVLFEALAADFGADAGDMGQLMALLGDDLGIETIIDGTVVYLRSPLLSMLGSLGAGLPTELAELGSGWGRVDLTEVPGLSAADLAALAGAQSGTTPDQVLAMLEDLGSLQEVGDAVIDGRAVTHYRTVVDIEAVLAAGAADLDAWGPGVAEDLEAAFSAPPTVDLYIDDAGNIARMTTALTVDELPDGGSYAVSTTIDMFDHGGDVTIVLPDDAVDLTGTFAQLAALGDGPI